MTTIVLYGNMLNSCPLDTRISHITTCVSRSVSGRDVMLRETLEWEGETPLVKAELLSIRNSRLALRPFLQSGQSAIWQQTCTTFSCARCSWASCIFSMDGGRAESSVRAAWLEQRLASGKSVQAVLSFAHSCSLPNLSTAHLNCCCTSVILQVKHQQSVNVLSVWT